MKQTIKIVCALTALASVADSQAVPFYSARSQSVNAARQMAGVEEDINRCYMDHIYGTFSITPEYTQTFRSNRIASCLFGSDLDCSNDCGSAIAIQGSLVANRTANAWLADYFGLPEDFSSVVSFKPRIRNFLVDLEFWIGLDELACGLYFDIHAPIVNTRWDLRACESVVSAGTLGYPEGYFSSNAVPQANLLTNALSFFSGAAVPTNLTNNNTSLTGNTSLPGTVAFQKLAYSRWATDCSCGSLKKTRLSDVEFALGWNFWCCDDYLLGLQIRASAPTGNKPDASYLFEPVVGAGGYWKLGGGLDFHSIFWRCEDESRSFGFYLHANVQHLFDTCQQRTFDLCAQGPNSRYMLAQRLQPATTNSNPDPLAPANAAGLQFASEFAPVANLTTFNVDVKVSVEADVAAKFAYVHDGFRFDLGYDFYGRSCEKFCPKSNCAGNVLDGQTWALKGDSQVFGFAFTGTTPSTTPIALAATQSNATIHSGVNNFASVSTVRQNTTAIDNATLSTNAAVAPAPTVPVVPQRSSGNAGATPATDPVLLSQSGVAFDGTRAISHKIFTNFSYEFGCEEDCWRPYIGIGGEVEFAGCGSCNDCDDSCNVACCTTPVAASACATSCCDDSCDSSNGSCFKCVPSQWGVWVKGGVSFN